MTIIFKRPIIAAVTAVLLGTTGFATLAHANKGEKDVQVKRFSSAQNASPKLTLLDAVTKAQVDNKGQMTSAKLENEEGKLVYAIEFKNGGKEHEVLIDAQTGAATNGDDD